MMSVEISNEVSAPLSLDVKFFQEVLENGLLEVNAAIKKITFEMGSISGENYCSVVYRVRITFQRRSQPVESISVIVKSIPVQDNVRFLEDLKVFLKEKIFYYSILPRMEILLDRVKLAPKLYHSHKEPINTLVFEDMTASGYVLADREKGLDLSHCLLVMKKIGQFHGTSMVLQKKDPDCMNSFGGGLLAADGVNGSEIYEKLFGSNIQGLIALISKWKGYEGITEKVKKYAASDIKQSLIKLQLPIPGELKVLNHGDLWVNNMLFKYTKDNKVEDVVFLDFQMSVYGSPGFDLNYFFNSSLQIDVLSERREELLKTYHTAMCDTLKAYSYKDIPSFEDILTEMRRREMYGFFTNYGILPAVTLDKSESADSSFDNLLDEERNKKKTEIMFSAKRLQETLRYTLKRFDELGVLD